MKINFSLLKSVHVVTEPQQEPSTLITIKLYVVYTHGPMHIWFSANPGLAHQKTSSSLNGSIGSVFYC